MLEAFSIVRLYAMSVEDGMTNGKSASHSVSTANTIVAAPAVNAQPSRLTALATTDARRASAAITPQPTTAHSSGASRPAAMT